jgi:hypothetical protein
MLRVGIESPHEGHKPIRRRKAIDPPKTLFGGMLDDRDTGRPILHDYPQPESDLAAGDPLVVCSNLRYCIRSVLVRLSDQPQHHDTGDEQYYTANDDKRQAVLDRDAHRRPIALQQYCKQQVTI